MSQPTSPSLSHQALLAAQTYSRRAPTYNNSWHPDYSARLTSLIPFCPGDSVLSLCCGTGLDLFPAAAAVGPSGFAVGVDVCGDMIAVARRELEHRRNGKTADVRLLLGDVTALDAVLGEEDEGLVPKDGFDVIICSNAFVLLPDPTGVAARWRKYLRPGGLLVVDIPREENMRSGRVMGGVAARLGKRWEAERSWIRGKGTFTDVLESAGYEVERVDELEKVVGRREVFYTADDADGQFDYVVRSDLADSGFMEEIGKDVRARELFREEFVKMAGQDGRVAVVEANYVYLARRRD